MSEGSKTPQVQSAEITGPIIDGSTNRTTGQVGADMSNPTSAGDPARDVRPGDFVLVSDLENPVHPSRGVYGYLMEVIGEKAFVALPKELGHGGFVRTPTARLSRRDSIDLPLAQRNSIARTVNWLQQEFADASEAQGKLVASPTADIWEQEIWRMIDSQGLDFVRFGSPEEYVQAMIAKSSDPDRSRQCFRDGRLGVLHQLRKGLLLLTKQLADV